MWENTTPSTELPRDFCAGIGPLQHGVVLVYSIFGTSNIIRVKKKKLHKYNIKKEKEIRNPH